MPDEGGAENQPINAHYVATEQGGWTDFDDIFKSPRDYLLNSIDTVRKFPGIAIDESQLPPDREFGSPLAVEDELVYLFKAGIIGKIEIDRPRLTDAELLALAADVWGLDENGLEIFTSEFLPRAEQRARQAIEKENEEWEVRREKASRFVIETWNADRFDQIAIQILSQISENRISNLHETVNQYYNVQRKSILEIPKEYEDILKIEDTVERRKKLTELKRKIAFIGGSLTFLTLTDIENISQREESEGFMYLDTFAEIVPVLYDTAAEGKRKENALRIHNFHQSEGIETYKLDQREEAFSRILYGAQNNIQRRNLLQRIMNRRGRNMAPQGEMM